MLKYASDQCFTNIPGGNPNFKFDQFVGAAQHYLGNTPLMDWTTDPCVGVGFGADYDEKANYSVVYALPAYRAVEHNAAYYLPPPFVERLYLQRGFFIETAKPEDDKSLQKACLSIRFKENRNFKVIRNGVEIPNLMKPLAVLDNLAIHAKEQSVNGVQFINEETENVEEAAQILQDEWNKIGGIPDVLQSDKAEQHAETWRESLLEMIERLTHLRTKEGLKVSEHLLNPVVCSNVQMMKSLKTWLRIQEKWARDEAKREDAAIAWGQRADLLDRSLNSIH